jgi:hypothetical protein
MAVLIEAQTFPATKPGVIEFNNPPQFYPTDLSITNSGVGEFFPQILNQSGGNDQQRIG